MLLLGAGEADQRLLLGLYAAERPWVALAAFGFTYLGDGVSLIAITAVAALWLFVRGRRRDAAWLILATMSGRALVFAQKLIFARLRPEEHLRLVEVSSLSFPSGHAANATMVFGGLALLAPREWRRTALGVAAGLALLVGASRPMLGVHWPSDVLGGWAFGALWLILCWKAGAMRRSPTRIDPH